jgi:hypothetical protein
LISENDLNTVVDNLSRKYSMKVIMEHNKYSIRSSMGYSPRRNLVMVNIPTLLQMLEENRTHLDKNITYEDYIESIFLHECHHSKINPVCRKITSSLVSKALLNVCEDYYINHILMKDNYVLISEGLAYKNELSKGIKRNMMYIEFKDIYTIFMLCSTCEKEELSEIYGDDMVAYKKIFESIKTEEDICKALSELSSCGSFSLLRK